MYLSAFQNSRVLHVFGYHTCWDCLWSFSFVLLHCDVMFVLHCSVKFADFVIQAALIKKRQFPIDTTDYFPSQIFDTPCEYVSFITKLLPVGIGSYCTFISNIQFQLIAVNGYFT